MLAPTTKEQREPMYRDLERIVSPGFLTATVRVGGVPFGVRSLGPNDLEFLRAVAKENGPEWTLWIAAASLWMIDGNYLLESYPSATKVAFDYLRASNRAVVRALFSVSLSFFRRQQKLNMVFESYFYEDSSRRLWKAVKSFQGQSLRGGFPGAERLGVNAYQEVWTDWNQSEDARHEDDYSWSLTKVLVSVQSNKSAKKLDEKDKTRAEGEKTRRAEVQDRAYYKWLGVLDETSARPENPRAVIHMPRTNADLAEEMRRWVAGELDPHDQIVSDYKDRIKQEVEAREAAKQQFLDDAAARREAQAAETGFTRPTLVGYTPEQMAQLVPANAKPGAKFIVEADPKSRTFNRYLRDAPDSGALKVDGDRVVPYTAPTREAPEPRPSLDALIANRKPILDGE
jgi:hypothetical protein